MRSGAKKNKGQIMTNRERLNRMSDEEFAEFLFDHGNGCGSSWKICAFHEEECDAIHAQEFCISQIVKWFEDKQCN